jgi:hypothetical protein
LQLFQRFLESAVTESGSKSQKNSVSARVTLINAMTSRLTLYVVQAAAREQQTARTNNQIIV